MSELDHIREEHEHAWRMKRDLPVDREPQYVDEAKIARLVAEAMELDDALRTPGEG